jgi:hypothetical protein
MIHRKTVLVLGAGASVPYGFPTGSQLKADILKGLTATSKQIFFRRHVEGAGADSSDIDRFVAALKTTQFDSIDVFLEQRREFEKVGKLAIAAALIPREQETRLLTAEDQHWYRFLFNQLRVDGHFSPSKLSVITLNYDRSLEQYLYSALRGDYGFDDAEAARQVFRIPIVHVHGQLGELAWKPARSFEQRPAFSRAYDPLLNEDTVRAAAEGIITISEFDPRANREFLSRIQGIVEEGETIGFLGFGYHHPVMQRLGIFEVIQKRNAILQCFGSTYGLPFGRHEEVRDDVHGIVLGHRDQNIFEFLQASRLLFQGRPGAAAAAV